MFNKRTATDTLYGKDWWYWIAVLDVSASGVVEAFAEFGASADQLAGVQALFGLLS